MELQQLRAFVSVAELGSMSRAATQLQVTQPAISFAIGGLERELGLRLFHRGASGLRLSRRGEELLVKARQVLRSAKEFVADATSEDASSGELRVSGRPGFLEYVFPLLVQKLRSVMPDVRISAIHSGDNAQVTEDLRLGRADLGFAASPGLKTIASEVMYRDPVWLAVSAGHPLARKKRVDLNALRSIPFCIPTAEDRLRPAINALFRKIGIRVGDATETNDYTIMRNLISTGGSAGFVFAHVLLANDVAPIRPLMLPEFRVSRELRILHRRDDLAPHVLHAREVMLREAQRILAANAALYLGTG